MSVSPVVRGLCSVLSGARVADFGAAGILLAALNAARLFAPSLADTALRSLAVPPKHLVDVTTTLCFVLTLAFVGVAALAWAMVKSRFTHAALDIAAIVVAVSLAAADGSFALVVATAVAIAVIAPLLHGEGDGAPDIAVERIARPASPRRGPAVFLVVAEAVSLGWGVWHAGHFHNQTLAAGAMAGVFGVVVVAVVLAALLRRDRAAGDAALQRCAVAGLPLLACALFGVTREPHVAWVVTTLALAAVLSAGAMFVPRVVAPLLRVGDAVAPLALVSVAVTPIVLRTLPSVNNARHEAFHAGWIEGNHDGRFFQADVDTVYGLLREWILTAYVHATELTLENLRVAFILVNIAGAALMIAAARPSLKGRPLAAAAFTYVLILYTPLRCIVFCERGVSLGWADLVRTSLAVCGVAGSLRLMARAREKPALLGLFLWGAMLGAAVLYSEEFGVTAVAATWTAYGASLLLQRGPRPSLGAIARTVGAQALGIAAVLGVTFAVYSAYGKGRLLLETSLLMVKLMGSGDIVFAPHLPITAATFLDPLTFLTKYTGDAAVFGNDDAEFALAPAIYVVSLVALTMAAVRRTFNARHTFELGLLAFGIVTQRITLSRPDAYHLLSTFPPALVLATSMIDRMSMPRLPRIAWSVVVAAGVLVVSERGNLGVAEMVSHERTMAAKYSDPPQRLARAGHITVEKELIDLVHYIDKYSRPKDSIFVRSRSPGMDGPQIYFLSDRRLPTRFAMTQELWTSELKHEAYLAIKKKPPRFVIGDDDVVIGPELARYFRENYEQVWAAGKWPVFAKKPPPGVLLP